MLHNLSDGVSLIHFAIEHRLDQIDRSLAHDPRNAKLVIHDFIYAIEWVLFVHESVEKDPEGPDILFLATIRFALQYFWRSVIYSNMS